MGLTRVTQSCLTRITCEKGIMYTEFFFLQSTPQPGCKYVHAYMHLHHSNQTPVQSSVHISIIYVQFYLLSKHLIWSPDLYFLSEVLDISSTLKVLDYQDCPV